MRSKPPQSRAVPVSVLEALDPRRFNLILLPTERCNFRCRYCYEDFRTGRMSPGVVRGVKSLLDLRVPDLDHLEVSWFGGEPLLAADIVGDISAHVLHLGQSYPRLGYRANMTTNGYLLNARTFATLTALGVSRYQVSLDGVAAQHDRTRVLAGGQGTFDRIWSNLVRIREADHRARIILRIHFAADTWRSLEPLVARVNAAFGGDGRFAVYFKSIERLGGPNDRAIAPLPQEEKERIRAHLEGWLLDPRQAYDIRADDGLYVCYAAKANSLVVRANGDVAKCTVALYDERNRIGSIAEDGRLALDRRRILPWLAGLESLDPGDLACPWGSVREEPPSRF